MKKKLAILLLSACMLTACGSKSPIKTGNEPIEHAVYTDDQLSLADYTGLKAEKKNYIITEKAIETRTHEALQEFAEYNSVSRPSKSGDYVQTNFKASINGSVVFEENQYDVVLGGEEFGKELDEKLTDVSIGDHLTFELNYEDDFTDVEWAGKTVAFDIEVIDIQEELIPEPTDEFIAANTNYSTYEEFVSAVRESVTESYAAESREELQEELLQQVIDASSIIQYTTKDYDAAKDKVNNAYLSYLDLFGLEDLDDVYEFLDMTDEDVEEEIQSTLYRTLIINAIIKNEDLSLTDEDFEEGVLYYMDQTESESREEFMKTYGEEEVRRQILEDKALNFLVEHAQITEVETEHDSD